MKTIYMSFCADRFNGLAWHFPLDQLETAIMGANLPIMHQQIHIDFKILMLSALCQVSGKDPGIY